MLELEGLDTARERRVWTGFIKENCFQGDQVDECSMLQEIKLTPGTTLRCKTVRGRVTRSEVAQ